MSNTLGHRTISSIRTQHDLVQDAKTMCHPRRDSFMFISFNLSFYITYYKIPIKASVKLLGQYFSNTLLSLYISPYPIKHNHLISLSRSLSTRIEPYKTTDRHRRSPSLSKFDPSSHGIVTNLRYTSATFRIHFGSHSCIFLITKPHALVTN